LPAREAFWPLKLVGTRPGNLYPGFFVGTPGWGIFLQKRLFFRKNSPILTLLKISLFHFGKIFPPFCSFPQGGARIFPLPVGLNAPSRVYFLFSPLGRVSHNRFFFWDIFLEPLSPFFGEKPG